MTRPNTASRQFAIAFVSAFAILLPCNYVAAEESAAAKNAAARDPKLDPIFLAIAKNYQQWGRVDDEMRWAPFLCRAPLPAKPSFSKSDDAATHGQKLYSLFAADRDAYVRASLPTPTQSIPVGTRLQIAELRDTQQIIVKESWTVKEATAEEASRPVERETKAPSPASPADQSLVLPAPIFSADHFSRYVRKDGKIYHAEELAGLYIMVQFPANQNDTDQKDTDDGWIYGTVSADGQQVTSSGLVQSCMNCHQKAPSGRLLSPYSTDAAK